MASSERYDSQDRVRGSQKPSIGVRRSITRTATGGTRSATPSGQTASVCRVVCESPVPLAATLRLNAHLLGVRRGSPSVPSSGREAETYGPRFALRCRCCNDQLLVELPDRLCHQVPGATGHA